MDPRMQKQPPFLPNEPKRIALTFDDGPDLQYTPEILEILDAYGVQSSFFCIGSQVQKFPNVLRRMVRDGHVVANHSWDHPYLTKESKSSVRMQLEQTSDIIEETVGLRPRLFRPPYGDINETLSTQVHSLGYDIVLWDVDSVDWSGISGPSILSNVLPPLKADSILLHHCAGNVSGTVDALPYLIEVAKAIRYQFVTIDVLLGTPAYCIE
ncbi:polysaccharide deacetylase family protein [Alicyclobacillus fastidiosus]|uniref:Polysaccharide deacetylase family protein n=2 Tax=Alicyclobacillus fastidiosus TaxID=392011 RepID=A0ABY6ZHY8_9BACL|nr:polysaccharide deacetylase family protein [Alicyclobacillus fastidiosus]WAH42533.1 polysaccharide deacetylase family protein [Alicyclobacillus fastidiosus]